MPGLVAIVTPPLSAQLATLAHAKEELGVTTTADDSYIANLINRASQVIVNYCSRPFGMLTQTETFRFSGVAGTSPASWSVAPYGTPLDSTFRPLISAAYPLWKTGATATENGAVLTLDTDFEIDTDAGLFFRLRGGLRSWWGVPKVVLSYRAGWVLPNDTPVSGVDPLPLDVEAACLSLVTAGYTARGRDPSVQMEITEGVGRTAYHPARGTGNMVIDSNLAQILDPYQNVVH
jgi:hypothetical protein